MAESSTKPYMIRALHEWCTDNGYTPHLTVKVDSNTMVPRGYIKDVPAVAQWASDEPEEPTP